MEEPVKRHIVGVEHIRCDGCSIFYISNLSDDLKAVIRSCLASVCHGAAKASTGRPMYCYKTTLSEFIRRYGEKKDSTRKGMIGELLLHILMSEFLHEYQINSPFFNLEERSIKKGFDVVLNKKGSLDIWLAEVKSGEPAAEKNSSQTAVSLINKAKNDLDERLNGESLSLWMNAINGAQHAIDNARDDKDAIIAILENHGDLASVGATKSTDINAILVGTVFANLTDPVDSDAIQEKRLRIIKEKKFNDVLLVAIQKETYDAVYAFLESESSQ